MYHSLSRLNRVSITIIRGLISFFFALSSISSHFVPFRCFVPLFRSVRTSKYQYPQDVPPESDAYTGATLTAQRPSIPPLHVSIKQRHGPPRSPHGFLCTMARYSTMRTLCALPLFLMGALSHMQMIDPSPLRDPHSDRAAEPKDYNILTPLRADGSDFSCKGYQWNTPLTPVATYKAGKTYTMELKGDATHGGGSCE
jgi:hypothetical protein